MNLASKKAKFINEKCLSSFKSVSFLIWGDLTLGRLNFSAQVTGQLSSVTGPVFSLRELSTDLKDTGFHINK